VRCFRIRFHMKWRGRVGHYSNSFTGTPSLAATTSEDKPLANVDGSKVSETILEHCLMTDSCEVAKSHVLTRIVICLLSNPLQGISHSGPIKDGGPAENQRPQTWATVDDEPNN
jgi:hypothetical protein